MIGLCERFGCLPSQLDREPTRLPGGRPGLLKLLAIQQLGTPAREDSDAGEDWGGEGW